MKHVDLTSGIGGFALAARWVGWETVGFCEIDPFCQKVLARNFPGVPQHDDLKTLEGGQHMTCDLCATPLASSERIRRFPKPDTIRICFYCDQELGAAPVLSDDDRRRLRPWTDDDVADLIYHAGVYLRDVIGRISWGVALDITTYARMLVFAPRPAPRHLVHRFLGYCRALADAGAGIDTPEYRNNLLIAMRMEDPARV